MGHGRCLMSASHIGIPSWASQASSLLFLSSLDGPPYRGFNAHLRRISGVCNVRGIWIAASEELRRSPIASIFTPLSAMIGGAGVLIAWWQLKAASPVTKAGTLNTKSLADHTSVSAAASILVIATFLSVTCFTASVTRFSYKRFSFFTTILSVPIAALSIFVNRWNAANIGFGFGEKVRSDAIDDLLFYGTVTLFLAIAGGKPILDLVRPPKGTKLSDQDVLGVIGALILAIVLWGGLVGWTQTRLTEAFLSQGPAQLTQNSQRPN